MCWTSSPWCGLFYKLTASSPICVWPQGSTSSWTVTSLRRISGFVKRRWSSRWPRRPMRRRWRDWGTTRSVLTSCLVPDRVVRGNFKGSQNSYWNISGCFPFVLKCSHISTISRWVYIVGADGSPAALLCSSSIQKWRRRWVSSRWRSKEENSPTLRSWWCSERTVSLHDRQLFLTRV